MNKLFTNKKDKEENEQKNTIFYNNDYLRLLFDNSLNENKKFSKNDETTSFEYKKKFRNYKIINDFLLKEQKYNYNVSTFFLIKLGGYNKILMQLSLEINYLIPEMKAIIKYSDLFQLIVEIMHLIYGEQEKLFLLNKDYFFKSKKANSTRYSYYIEVKKRIESNIKKQNYDEIDQYIENEIFKDNYENVLKEIYSGLVKNNKSISFHFFQGNKKPDYTQDLGGKNEIKERKRGQFYGGRNRYNHSSSNLITDLLKEEVQEESNLKKSLPKNNTKSILFNKMSLDNSFYNNNIKNKNSKEEEEDQLELHFEEEIHSSETNPNSINVNGTDKSSNTINKPSYRRMKERQKTVNSSNLLSQGFYIFHNKTRNGKSERSYSISPMESKFINYNKNTNNIVPHINFFDEPDEYYLKNAKKELMMSIFSLYFFDYFFYNNDFKQLKNYYLQNFEGV